MAIYIVSPKPKMIFHPGFIGACVDRYDIFLNYCSLFSFYFVVSVATILPIVRLIIAHPFHLYFNLSKNIMI